VLLHNITSIKDVLERETVEDTETMRSSDSETPLILIEAHVEDLFFGVVGGSTLNEGMWLN
jgi:hypothetical protein